MQLIWNTVMPLILHQLNGAVCKSHRKSWCDRFYFLSIDIHENALNWFDSAKDVKPLIWTTLFLHAFCVFIIKDRFCIVLYIVWLLFSAGAFRKCSSPNPPVQMNPFFLGTMSRSFISDKFEVIARSLERLADTKDPLICSWRMMLQSNSNAVENELIVVFCW